MRGEGVRAMVMACGLEMLGALAGGAKYQIIELKITPTEFY